MHSFAVDSLAAALAPDSVPAAASPVCLACGDFTRVEVSGACSALVPPGLRGYAAAAAVDALLRQAESEGGSEWHPAVRRGSADGEMEEEQPSARGGGEKRSGPAAVRGLRVAQGVANGVASKASNGVANGDVANIRKDRRRRWALSHVLGWSAGSAAAEWPLLPGVGAVVGPWRSVASVMAIMFHPRASTLSLR